MPPAHISAKVERRSGRWADINQQTRPGYDVLHERTYATMHLEHSDGAAAAWMLLPGATVEQTRSAAEGEGRNANVLRNDAAAQIVDVAEGARAFVIWAPGAYEGWRFDQSVVVFSQRRSNELTLVVSEPTQREEFVALSLPGEWRLLDGNAEVAVRGDSTRVVLSTADREGRALTVMLGSKRDEQVAPVPPVPSAPRGPGLPSTGL